MAEGNGASDKRIRLLPRSSPDYTPIAAAERERIATGRIDKPFGEGMLDGLNLLKESPDDPRTEMFGGNTPEQKRRNFITVWRVLLDGMHRQKSSKSWAENFFYEMATSPDIKDMPDNYVFSWNRSPDDFYSNFSTISFDSFEWMIERHVQNFYQAKEKVAEQLPELTNDFNSKLRRLSRELEFSLPDDFDKRIKDIDVALVDPLSNIKMWEHDGLYHPAARAVWVPYSWYGMDNLVITPSLFHEFVHHGAGSMSLILNDEVLDLKEGVAIPHQKTDKLSFEWMDEAITQDLTIAMYEGEFVHGGYSENMELLNMLIGKGKEVVPSNLFYSSYFEDYDPKRNAQNQFPHGRALRERIGRAYVPGFLSMVDRYVRDHGLPETIEQMNHDWRRIPPKFGMDAKAA